MDRAARDHARGFGRRQGDGARRGLSAGVPLVAAAVVLLVATLGAAPAEAADGTGTMTVSPTYVVSSSTGNDLTFTYTAGAGGVSNGEIAVLIPTGWTTPNQSGFEAGGVNATCEVELPTISSVAGGHLVRFSEVFLSNGQTCTIHYGIAGFNSGDTAPATTGIDTFTAEEKSTSGGTLTTLSAASPQVVVGDDGTGTMAPSPNHVVVGSTGNTITFNYTAARTMSSGQLGIAVPAGWSTPSTTPTAAGYTTSTCGTVGVSGSEITISGVSMSSGAGCAVTYGSKAGGGPGVTAPATSPANEPADFTTQEESTNDSNLVALAVTPTVTVTAADGAGELGVSPTSEITSSTGDDLTFTFTAPAGGLRDGELTLLVPTGWTTPTLSTGSPGGFISLCGNDENSTVTAVGEGHLITIPEVFLKEHESCEIEYGINGFNPGVTAPSSSGHYTFTTQEKSTAAGTLTGISSSPAISVSTDGTGTMTIPATHVAVNSTGNTLTFTYTAATTISSGEIAMTVPEHWSTPSTTGTAAGDTTSTCGTVGVAGSDIAITGVSLASSGTCTVTYGSKTGGGPGATAASTSPTNEPQAFSTREKSSAGGTLTALGAGSPKVTVTAADGAGELGVSPTSEITSSTGDDLTFTFTAPAGGLHDGELTLLVPTGWTTPTLSTGSAGGFISLCGSDENNTVTAVGEGHLITIPEVFLKEHESCEIEYGINGFNPGVTAPSASAHYTFTAQEESAAGGTLTGIASSPVVDVSNDGTGTMTIPATHVAVNSTGNTLGFSYTAGTAISNGELTMAVPEHWSAPSTNPTAAGYTTSNCGTVGVSGSTIQITAVSLAKSEGCTVTYGSKTGGGPGATVSPTAPEGLPATFTTEEKSSSGGTLTVLGAGSPKVVVTAGDGSGTMAVSPTTAVNETTGNDFTFTYTAPAGGLDEGEITVLVPTGWTTPSATTSSPGGFTSTCGPDEHNAVTTVAEGHLMVVPGVTLAEGETCTIEYGINGFNAGVTAPASSGSYAFTTQEESTASGTPTNIATSPTVNVSSDGAGNITPDPAIASAGASGNTVAFTYTSTVSLSSGEITLAVPGGWSAPSITGTDAGFTTTNCSGGSVGVSGHTIQVTGISIAKGASCAVTYGDRSSGGPGAIATAAVGTSQFDAQEKSTSGGTLGALAASPHVTVFAADGGGTLEVAPDFAAPGSTGNTLTFTYTAPSGGLSGGQLSVAVPNGWSVPSTTAKVSGYTSSNCGGVAVVGSAIQVSGVTLAGGGSCTITYGDRGGGGAGATAPSASGVSAFTATEESTGFGSATGLASSPQVAVTAPDGSGAVAVTPAVADAGSTGNTLTFTYTAANGGLSGGELALKVPEGWSAPVTARAAAGYTSASCGIVSLSGTTIEVNGVTLAGGGACTIAYGSRVFGGPGATAPAGPVTGTFAASEMSTPPGLLTPLASSPSVTVSVYPTLTVTVSGSGSVSGGGISCPGNCSRVFSPGTLVSLQAFPATPLSASPSAGSAFAGWSGACSGTGACNVTMSADQSVTATFLASSSGSPKTSCSLTATSGRLRRAGKRKHAKPDAVALDAKCDAAVIATVTGVISERLPGRARRGRHQTKTFPLPRQSLSLSAGAGKTVTLRLPAAALRALAGGAKESAVFTLIVPSASGSQRFEAQLRMLRR